jgi:hypothetical protein
MEYFANACECGSEVEKDETIVVFETRQSDVVSVVGRPGGAAMQRWGVVIGRLPFRLEHGVRVCAEPAGIFSVVAVV